MSRLDEFLDMTSFWSTIGRLVYCCAMALGYAAYLCGALLCATIFLWPIIVLFGMIP